MGQDMKKAYITDHNVTSQNTRRGQHITVAVVQIVYSETCSVIKKLLLLTVSS